MPLALNNLQRVDLPLNKETNQRFNYTSSVWTTKDAVLRTYQERWTIGMDGERESRNPVLLRQHHIDANDLLRVFSQLVQSNRNILNRSIGPVDMTLSITWTPNQSGPGNNSREWVLQAPHTQYILSLANESAKFDFVFHFCNKLIEMHLCYQSKIMKFNINKLFIYFPFFFFLLSSFFLLSLFFLSFLSLLFQISMFQIFQID